jgi:hypothetical protein
MKEVTISLFLVPIRLALKAFISFFKNKETRENWYKSDNDSRGAAASSP